MDGRLVPTERNGWQSIIPADYNCLRELDGMLTPTFAEVCGSSADEQLCEQHCELGTRRQLTTSFPARCRYGDTVRYLSPGVSVVRS